MSIQFTDEKQSADGVGQPGDAKSGMLAMLAIVRGELPLRVDRRRTGKILPVAECLKSETYYPTPLPQHELTLILVAFGLFSSGNSPEVPFSVMISHCRELTSLQSKCTQKPDEGFVQILDCRHSPGGLPDFILVFHTWGSVFFLM
jgi:hypothetical protein